MKHKLIIKLFDNWLGRCYLGVPRGKKIYKITQSSVHYYTGEISEKNDLPIICTGNCSPGGRFVYNRIMRLAKLVSIFALLPIIPKALLPLIALTDTGYKSPSATGGSYNQWTDPTNAYESDDQYADMLTGDLRQSYRAFDFQIFGAGSTIVGIQGMIEGFSTGGSSILRTLHVALSHNAGSSWTSEQSVELPQVEDVIFYGGASDLWDRSWTQPEFSDANFRMYIRGVGQDYVDQIQFKVFYTVNVAEEKIEKSLKYCVTKEIAAITKSLRYAILTIPSAKTKSLQYEIIIKDTIKIEKSLEYNVISPTAIGKSLSYGIKGILVKFNGVDKTNRIKRESFMIENVLTKAVDSCKMVIEDSPTGVFKPDYGDEVTVFDDGDKVFGGIVVKITDEILGSKVVRYEVECVDYTRLADKELVAEIFEEKKIEDIIQDIVDKYLDGFTTVNVSCSTIINYISFNYQPFSTCLKELADLVGYDWYIDYDKDIHFFDKEDHPAPFNLTDDNGEYIFDSLVLSEDISQLKNVVYVRGGEYLAEEFTEKHTADGESRDFKIGYKYKNLAVEVNGVGQSVGVDYANDPDDFDCLHNFQEKLIKFREDNKPSDEALIEISGNPYIPVVIQAKDDVSITEFGRFEFRIVDESIKTKTAARERGNAEISAYANELTEGSFETYEKGLRSGQKINVQSTLRGIDKDFVINKVRATMRTYDKMEYEVFLVTTRTIGIIDILRKLLTADDKRLAIGEDEVVDKIWAVEPESFVIDEGTPVFTSVTGPWYVDDGNVPVGVCGFCEAS